VGPAYGYHLPFFDQLDAVLISHLHPDHTFTQVVPGGVPNLVGLDSAGHFQAIQQDVRTAAVRDVASYHDNNAGHDRGENAMWVIDIDGFHIVHLGDLGETQLTDQQLSDLGKPDILMIPVGGKFTIDGNQARGIVNQLQPRLVIPMHYATDRTPPTLGLGPVNDFLGGAPPARAPNSIQLQKSDLPSGRPAVQVMNYK
jgi:L-ascorbate metabolism protein UlaG (beta-lactamase superfamily)